MEWIFSNASNPKLTSPIPTPISAPIMISAAENEITSLAMNLKILGLHTRISFGLKHEPARGLNDCV